MMMNRSFLIRSSLGLAIRCHTFVVKETPAHFAKIFFARFVQFFYDASVMIDQSNSLVLLASKLCM